MQLRLIIVYLFATLFITCNKEDLPEPIPFRPGNFGTVISFADTMRVYDATIGTLTVKSRWVGALVGAYQNNVTIDDDTVAYQGTYTGLLGVNIKTGAPVRKFSASGFNGFSSGGGVASCRPVIEGNKIYYIMEDNIGYLRLFCINKSNGTIFWQSQERTSFDPYAQYYSSIEVTDNKIITNMYDGPACFDKNTGQLLWRNNSLKDFEFLNEYPKIYANNKILVVSKRKAYCLDIETGNILWSVTLSGANVSTSPLLMNDTLVCHSSFLVYPDSQNGFLLDFIDLQTGKIIKTYSSRSEVFLSYEKGFFYAGTRFNPAYFPQQLTKYDMASLSPVWHSTLAGAFSLGFTITPEYLYCTEVDPINTSSWQKLTILDKQNGKTLNSFPIPYVAILSRFTVKLKDGSVYGTLKGY